MDLSEEIRLGADPHELYELITDLTNYPDWLGLVARVDAESAPQLDPRGSWIVELQGRVGPFARSKRLRMVRSVAEPPSRVRYEREETDGRDHAPWHLEAIIEPEERGVTLTMQLHYGGTRFVPILMPILHEEIRKGRRLLLELYPLS